MKPIPNIIETWTRRAVALSLAVSMVFAFALPVFAAVCAPEASTCCCAKKRAQPSKLNEQKPCCDGGCDCSIQAPSPSPMVPTEEAAAPISYVVAAASTVVVSKQVENTAEVIRRQPARAPPACNSPPIYLQFESLLI